MAINIEKAEETVGTVVISAKEYRTLIEQLCLMTAKLKEAGEALAETVETYDSSRSLFVRDKAVINVVKHHFPETYKRMMAEYEAEWAKREAEKEADDK